jgi:hypothetical protein
MDETQDRAVAPSARPGKHDGHRRPVRGKMWELEGRWLMGRVAPREMLEGIGRYWMRAVDPAVSGLRAERTSLMSLGDDACRFRVVRTGDPLAPYSDALDQRFSGGQAAG